MSALAKRGLVKDRKVMPFIQEVKKQVSKHGSSTFNRALLFDEQHVLSENKGLVEKSLGLTELEIVEVMSGLTLDDPEDAKKAEVAVPGQPALRLWNC
jgi:leucyl-tRNA synthetase